MTGSFTMSGPKMSLSRRLPMAGSLRGIGAPRYGRHDRDLVLLCDLGLQPRPQPDVLVVEVDVDELPELSLVVQQAVPEAGEARIQRLDGRAEVARLDLHRDLAVGKPPERAWNAE